MGPIGFSTGALAFERYAEALRMLHEKRVRAVKLSALRERELVGLLDAVETLDLSAFRYISFHAPSAFEEMSEEEAKSQLERLTQRGWPIIMHPDAMRTPEVWRSFGKQLCLENMDKRKCVGRTVDEMDLVFERLPDASFCFDIGHARQVDPTMHLAARLLRRFGTRLVQVHISEVNTRSKHEAISFSAKSAFQRVAHLIPTDTPIIIESVIGEERIELEMAVAREGLSVGSREPHASGAQLLPRTTGA